MKYGFVKTAALSPALRVADCEYNTQQIIAALDQAHADGVQLACLPELCITGCTCGDLVFQYSLLQGAGDGLMQIIDASSRWNLAALVGLPMNICGKLYNCAAVVCSGELLGIVAKSNLTADETRWYAPAPEEEMEIDVCGCTVPFGSRLLFQCNQLADFCFAAEIGEDLWAAVPPSTIHALAGATIIANLSASSESAGKDAYRCLLAQAQSARVLCGYVCANPGHGESTTDLVFGAHDLIAENGVLLCEKAPFAANSCITDIDVERLACERLRSAEFAACEEDYVTVPFDLALNGAPLTRKITRNPFVPEGEEAQRQRFEMILTMQADGLVKRMEHAHCKTAVIGISGGLDSCLALLVAVRAMQQLGRPATDVHAISMPCFGTTSRTRSNAQVLCEELGVSFQEVRIADTVRSHFKDIGQDEANTDVTFENGQARVRTLLLMDYANRMGGLVVGTGDLSELALGWATYNGDHMSMYGVNAGVPKTLVQHVVRHAAMQAESETLRKVLLDILDTPVSPELLPAKDGQITQQTEQLVGPYELHDFYLFYALRYGFSPAKVYYLAQNAFDGQYTDDVLKHWLHNFYRRFFMQQFKRSCLPDGPKIGSVGLSPRGDWRMPSDACSALWLKELETLD